MTKIKHLLTIFALSTTVASCDSWEPDLNPDTGTLDMTALTVDIDTNFVDVVSRTADETVDLSGYAVTLTDNNNNVVEQWPYSLVPGTVELPVGEYTLSVACTDIKATEWDTPAYKGSVKVTITDDDTTLPGAITCTPTGAQVSIVYTDALKELMSDDTQTSVSLSDDIMLSFTKTETRTGCFNALYSGDNSLLVKFKGIVNEQPVEVIKAITGVTAGSRYIMTFSLKSDADETSVVIDVREPVNPDAPVISSTTLDLTGTTTLTPSNVGSIRALIDILAPKGIKELHIKIESDKLTPVELSMVGLAGEFDLCNPGNLGGALMALGFPVGDAVIDKTRQSFDITFFLSLLVNFPGKNDFVITVVDNDGNTTAQTVSFYVP